RKVGDAVVVRHRGSAPRPDGLDHLVGDAGGGAGSVDVAAQIVHHHRRALAAEQLRDRPADATAGAGDDRRTSLQSLTHRPHASLGGAGLGPPWSTVRGASRSRSSSVHTPSVNSVWTGRGCDTSATAPP